MKKTYLLKRISELYSNNLWSSPLALNYLVNERGLSESIIHKFKLGFAKGNLVAKAAKEEGWLDKAIEYNVVNWNMTDFFEGYITIPVFYKDDYYNITGRGLLNISPPHKTIPGVHKDGVFNEQALEKSAVIIVEGPIDAMTLVQHGLNSCAVLGIRTNFNIVPKFKNKICYILFDGDSSGKLGADKLAKKLVPVAKRVSILNFPGDKFVKVDANSYFLTVKNAANRIIFLAKNSVAISNCEFGVKTEKTKKIAGDPHDKLDIVVVGKKLFSGYTDKGSGGIWVSCPIHKEGNESNKSLWVGGRNNMFYCFGCDVGGGPIKLVSWSLGISMNDAVQWLDDKVQ